MCPSPPPLPASLPSTAGLLVRAQAGDRAAYGRLVQAVVERVRLYARLRLGPRLRSEVDTEDVLQEAWLEAHRSLATFSWQGEGSFTRWVNRIVENRIRGLIDHHGAAKRRPADGRREPLSQVEVPAEGAGPASAAARREDDARLVEAMDTLGEEERSALLLRFHLGRTLDECAHALGRSVPATRRLLGRALASLARRLGAQP